MSRLCLALIAFMLSSAAFAETAREIDLTTVLMNGTGVPFMDTMRVAPDDPQCAKCAPLTLGHAVAYALFGNFPDEATLPPDQKWARGALAFRIRDADKMTFTAGEIVVIERCVGKMFNPAVVAQIFPLLDPAAKPPDLH